VVLRVICIPVDLVVATRDRWLNSTAPHVQVKKQPSQPSLALHLEPALAARPKKKKRKKGFQKIATVDACGWNWKQGNMTLIILSTHGGAQDGGDKVGRAGEFQ
jgi:hypothetical protein